MGFFTTAGALAVIAKSLSLAAIAKSLSLSAIAKSICASGRGLGVHISSSGSRRNDVQ